LSSTGRYTVVLSIVVWYYRWYQHARTAVAGD
jgi:hypothetical protein